MTSLVDASEALALDGSVERSWSLGPGLLMESAAVRLSIGIEPLVARGAGGRVRKIVAVAGGGNNGGDALALLRHLAFSRTGDVAALVPSRELKALAAGHAASLAAGGIPLWRWNSTEGRRALAEADIVIDGVVGTGLSGPLSGEAAAMVAAINGRAEMSDGAAQVVSIDLPSGFRSGCGVDDVRVDADFTLSIEPRKLCLYAPALRPSAGEIVAIDGVFPKMDSGDSRAALLDASDIAALRLHPQPWIHKGGRGRVAIFAGSPGMTGALLLAARAAQAAGAGLVTLFVRGELFEALKAAGPETIGGAIVRPEASALGDLGPQDAILAGPGWGRDDTRTALLSFLLATRIPLVLDADALRTLPNATRIERDAPLILTPHPGEFEALSGRPTGSVLASPHEALADVASAYRAIVALKTATTWIMAPDGRLRVVDGREAGLAVAGSGDVLAGLMAGLLAAALAGGNRANAEKEALRAASLAALVHVEAGRALRSRGGWFEASGLVRPAAALLGRLPA